MTTLPDPIRLHPLGLADQRQPLSPQENAPVLEAEVAEVPEARRQGLIEWLLRQYLPYDWMPRQWQHEHDLLEHRRFEEFVQSLDPPTDIASRRRAYEFRHGQKAPF